MLQILENLFASNQTITSHSLQTWLYYNGLKKKNEIMHSYIHKVEALFAQIDEIRRYPKIPKVRNGLHSLHKWETVLRPEVFGSAVTKNISD